ncbi:MAG: hypothetical protein HOJ95_00015 [Nitrospinaceae bacterium]|jgi:hypothetical protein|nr:hypothetical protein [Nitrospinaceae bacterium]
MNHKIQQKIRAQPQDSGDNSDSKPAEKPLSLAPLKFEEAMKGLLRVKPSSDG